MTKSAKTVIICVYNPFGKGEMKLLPDIKVVNLDYCNSSTVRLVRAADIVSNRLFYMAVNEQIDSINREDFFITFLPKK